MEKQVCKKQSEFIWGHKRRQNEMDLDLEREKRRFEKQIQKSSWRKWRD